MGESDGVSQHPSNSQPMVSYSRRQSEEDKTVSQVAETLVTSTRPSVLGKLAIAAVGKQSLTSVFSNGYTGLKCWHTHRRQIVFKE